jgi:hypothetical protein
VPHAPDEQPRRGGGEIPGLWPAWDFAVPGTAADLARLEGLGPAPRFPSALESRSHDETRRFPDALNRTTKRQMQAVGQLNFSGDPLDRARASAGKPQSGLNADAVGVTGQAGSRRLASVGAMRKAGHDKGGSCHRWGAWDRTGNCA